ncbi:aconitase X swivel domain-containing protein [Arthrobacter cryoconiti]|nr:DUF126 domain-containing protein [Arthrobacter cryoconiti]MCC9067375.1 DUF126 domain-containing protein [Arthrobacter cryoconiti]
MSGQTMRGLTLCCGDGCGALLALDEPLSFWGGMDRNTGMIIDTHHPQSGTSMAGRVILMDASRGSSSSSSVLAEAIRAGVGPAAILLLVRDAIVALGVMAAAELYGTFVPVVLLDAEQSQVLHASASGVHICITAHASGHADVVLYSLKNPH